MEIAVDKNIIVNQFNKCFTSIGTNLNAKLPQKAQDPTHLINNNSANFFSAPTCPAEIINIVNIVPSQKKLVVMTTLIRM